MYIKRHVSILMHVFMCMSACLHLFLYIYIHLDIVYGIDSMLYSISKNLTPVVLNLASQWTFVNVITEAEE